MPSTVEIQQQLDDIAAMQDAFVQPSCESKDPMVKYPSTGTPPTLDFNVPQSTAFNTYGRIVKNIEADWFKPFCRAVPQYNFFSYVQTLTPQSVTQLFHPNVSAVAVPGTFVPAMGATVGGSVRSSGAGLSVRAASIMNSATVASARVPIDPSSGVAVPSGSAGIQGTLVQPGTGGTMPNSAIVNFAQQNIRGLYTYRVMNGGATIKYIAQPKIPRPCITVIEEYTTTSYLGNYGAGRVLKTFSLFPGEQTTISVRTYRDEAITSAAADNMLDSFSNSAATQLDNLMQEERGTSNAESAENGGNSASYNTYANAHNSQSAWNISANLGMGALSIGGGYGRSTSDTTTSGGGFSEGTNYSHGTVRTSNINTLASAMNRSVQESNANRQISIAHSRSASVNTGEETTTVRLLQNVNLSRVLNITFRQLLQEYITITHLSNLKFAYSNGYAESYTIVDLANLPNMLDDIIEPDPMDPDLRKNAVMCLLLKHYCSVRNYKDQHLKFIEAVTDTIGGCLTEFFPDCEPETETIWRVDKTCIDTYDEAPLDIEVKGVILNVQKQVLQTSSMIADALLGAGEALDCFNQKVQDATAMAGYINNLQAMQVVEQNNQNRTNDQTITDQKVATIDAILTTPDPVSAATLYKKVYGDCCDVPQNTDNGCGCGGGGGC